MTAEEIEMQMPYQKWFWRDWLADQAILMLTPEHRCIWFEMLGLMASSENPGYLETFGVEPELFISFQRRIQVKSVTAGMAAIEKLGLFSRDDSGRIFSRRIIREADELQKQLHNGSKGGRPKTQSQNPEPKPNTETPIAIAIAIAKEEDKSPDGSLSETEVSDTPHQQIIAIWHEVCPMLPRVNEKLWDGNRATMLRARWKQRKEFQSLDFWRQFFRLIASSPFLTGQVTGRNGRAFQATLAWCINAENFKKILEGNYSPRASAAEPFPDYEFSERRNT